MEKQDILEKKKSKYKIQNNSHHNHRDKSKFKTDLPKRLFPDSTYFNILNYWSNTKLIIPPNHYQGDLTLSKFKLSRHKIIWNTLEWHCHELNTSAAQAGILKLLLVEAIPCHVTAGSIYSTLVCKNIIFLTNLVKVFLEIERLLFWKKKKFFFKHFDVTSIFSCLKEYNQSI